MRSVWLKGSWYVQSRWKTLRCIWKILDKETSFEVVLSLSLAFLELSRQMLGWRLREGH